VHHGGHGRHNFLQVARLVDKRAHATVGEAALSFLLCQGTKERYRDPLIRGHRTYRGQDVYRLHARHIAISDNQLGEGRGTLAAWRTKAPTSFTRVSAVS
jgi:hypothetical protein